MIAQDPALLAGIVAAVLLALVNLVLLLRHAAAGPAARDGAATREALTVAQRMLAEQHRAEALALRETVVGSERALASRAETARMEAQIQLGALTERMVREQAAQRTLMEVKLREMAEQAAQRLAVIQHSVNAQLAESIEKQMQGSFQRVVDQFALVQKAMTDVQAVTADIGDLKRLFGNVKSRGGWGEAQLRALLMDVLPPEAWEANRRLRDESDEVVEFVLVMPGSGQPRPVLALDAKFPAEDYDRMLLAAEAGDAEAERTARRALEQRLRAEARKIASKYIVPPVTVDYAVMYLPTDSLYVEAARMPGLIESLGREHRVMVMGPALLPALLRTLQLGAMSLQIAENAKEIERTLGAVRGEFRQIDAVLGRLEKQTGTVNRTVAAARVRTRAMDRQLGKVALLAGDEAAVALQLGSALDEQDDTAAED